MRRLAFAVLSLAVWVGPAREARADEGSDAGEGTRRPRFAVTVDRLLPLVSHTRQSVSWTEGTVGHEVEDSGTTFAFVGREPSLGVAHTIPRLAFDVTVFEGLTVGTSLAFAVGVAGPHVETRSSAGVPDVVRASDAPRGTLLGFGPRVGYTFPVARTLSIWPRAGFSFYALTRTTEEAALSGVVARTESTDTLFSLDLDAPLAWAPFEHVVLLAGPLVNVPLMGAHATELSQAGIVKERSDQLRVLHLGLVIGMGLTFDP